jgi:hypothetical protein
MRLCHTFRRTVAFAEAPKRTPYDPSARQLRFTREWEVFLDVTSKQRTGRIFFQFGKKKPPLRITATPHGPSTI